MKLTCFLVPAVDCIQHGTELARQWVQLQSSDQLSYLFVHPILKQIKKSFFDCILKLTTTFVQIFSVFINWQSCNFVQFFSITNQPDHIQRWGLCCWDIEEDPLFYRLRLRCAESPEVHSLEHLPVHKLPRPCKFL